MVQGAPQDIQNIFCEAKERVREGFNNLRLRMAWVLRMLAFVAVLLRLSVGLSVIRFRSFELAIDHDHECFSFIKK